MSSQDRAGATQPQVVPRVPPWGWTVASECDDMALIERLVAFYRAAFSESHYSSWWNDFFHTKHQREHQTFMTGSLKECADLMRNPALSDMQYGFELTNRTHTPGLKASATSIEALYESYRNCLIALAESLGVVRLQPEYGSTFERPSNDDLVKAIELVAGEISFPNPVSDEFGLLTCRGIASGRAIQSIYQALRIRNLAGAGAKIAEIGAGLGRTAYNANRFGVRDYTIVDLPFSCLSSGYFLGRCLGAEKISLRGDSDGPIKFISPDDFLAGSERYDLVVSIDSITELSRPHADAYVAAIRNRAKIFLSINHDGNAFTVRDLMGGCAERYPYWFRKGYAEEVFHL